MLSNIVRKLFYHKIIVIILTALNYCCGFFTLTKIDLHDILVDNYLLYFCWFGMILLLLLIAVCFDSQLQPFLLVYRSAIVYLPYLYFTGFVLSLFLLHIIGNRILSVAVFSAFDIVALIVFMICNLSLKHKTDEFYIRQLDNKLINLSEIDLSQLKRHKKFSKWLITLTLIAVIIAGRYLIPFKIVYIGFTIVVGLFCAIGCYQIYKIRCKTLRVFLCRYVFDFLVYSCFATISILVNYGVIPYFSGTADSLDITLPLIFGLIPYAKQTSFAYFAEEHEKIRQEIRQARELT